MEFYHFKDRMRRPHCFLGVRMSCVLVLVPAFLLCSGFRGVEDKNVLDTEHKFVVEDNGSDITLIGDSRIYQMRLATEDRSVNWIAASGSGYDWFAKSISPIMDKEDLRNKTIIIEYGINDVWFYGGVDTATSKWIPFYYRKAQQWVKRGATVEAVLLMPTVYGPANRKITYFNEELVASVPSNIRLINVNDIRFQYVDDLHFTDETGRELFEAIMDRK